MVSLTLKFSVFVTHGEVVLVLDECESDAEVECLDDDDRFSLFFVLVCEVFNCK